MAIDEYIRLVNKHWVKWCQTEGGGGQGGSETMVSKTKSCFHCIANCVHFNWCGIFNEHFYFYSHVFHVYLRMSASPFGRIYVNEHWHEIEPDLLHYIYVCVYILFWLSAHIIHLPCNWQNAIFQKRRTKRKNSRKKIKSNRQRLWLISHFGV